ncbi:DUF1127 domain-containing protein [Roseomonas sp. M0104]|uniref:DUF1127 domain-containing protein n=2 Tax=Teichococcus coralli TaxID=2545983 RepID=A0A845B836_9PROT|nr:DUF1127 domain-containing protein [Pseudoroseomonas coralli]
MRRRLADPLRVLLRVAQLMLARSRERQALASFDARMLRDIGVTPYEAGVEARKPFWRA